MEATALADRSATEDQIRDLLGLLSAAVEQPQIPSVLSPIITITKLLDDSTTTGYRAKEAFRIHNGFEIILNSFRVHFDAYHQVGRGDQDELLEVSSRHLLVLSIAVDSNPRNSEHFVTSIDGWEQIQETLTPVFARPLTKSHESQREIEVSSRLLGDLLAIALRRENLNTLFCAAEKETSSDSLDTDGASDTVDVQKKAQGNDDLKAPICDPNLLVIMLKLCLNASQTLCETNDIQTVSQLRSGGDSEELHSKSILRLFNGVYSTISYLTTLSDSSCLALHRAGALTVILHFLLRHPQSSADTNNLVSLSRTLLRNGLTRLEDAECLLLAPQSAQSITDVLLDAARSCPDPARFTFDLSIAGYASLELPQLGSFFPPLEPARGYSVMMWMRVEKYDDSCHTTLFGAFDATQTCFVLIYLERKHRQLVLQTSLSSKDPSVRFRSVNFQENQFYHITIVHQRSHTAGPARALLFVDGVFREQARCAFPSRPPRSPVASGKAQNNIGTLSPVQAFFGTPHDLSPRLGAGLLYSKWSLAMGHLFGNTMPEELILVYQKLGPSYRGNFQDCLGSFQTYDASARLNLLNESLVQGGSRQSFISAAIHSPGSKINPESDLLLSLLPTPISSIHTHKPWAWTDSSLIQGTRISSYVPNAAVPSLLKARTRRHGLVSVMGGTCLTSPLSIQEAMWRLSGCVPIVLERVARASTADLLMSAVAFYFESFKNNWRNSEAMERRHGYGILALLLQSKLCEVASEEPDFKSSMIPLPPAEIRDGDLAFRLLELILRATSQDYDTEFSAMITNPLAYRMLVIDSDIWHRVGPRTQCLFYDQILVFISKSSHSNFNIKRLLRMRLLKRFIEINKSGFITQESCQPMTAALSKLLEKSMDAESFRSIALYITHALHTRSEKLPPTLHKATAGSGSSDYPVLTNMDVGVMILELLTNLICHELGKDAIFKFSRSVTTKWLLYLFHVEDQRVVVPAFKLLTQMLITGGESFRAKFEAKQGYTLLRLSIRKWYHLEDIWLMTFALMFAVNSFDTRLGQLQDLSEWLMSSRASDELEISCPAAWALLQDLLKEAIRDDCARVDSHSGKERRTTDPGLLLFIISLMSAIYSQVSTFRRQFAPEELARQLLSVLFFGAGSGAQSVEPDDYNDSSKEDSLSDSKPLGYDPIGTHQELGEEGCELSENTPVRRGNPGGQSQTATVSSQMAKSNQVNDFVRPLAPSKMFDETWVADNVCFCDLKRLLITICADQVLDRGDFYGLGLYLKAPPASDAKRSWLNSLILSGVFSNLQERLSSDASLFQSPTTITNIVRLIRQGSEATIEGWYIDGSHKLLSFIVTFLDRVQQRSVSNLKSVRLCAPSIDASRSSLSSLIFYELATLWDRAESLPRSSGTESDLQLPSSSANNGPGAIERFLPLFRHALRFVQAPTESEDISENSSRFDPRLLPSLIYLLYRHIRYGKQDIRLLATDSFRALFENNLARIRSILQTVNTPTSAQCVEQLLDMVTSQDVIATLAFIESHVVDLDGMMSGSPEMAVSSLIRASNTDVLQKAVTRSEKRRSRLHECHLQDLAQQHAWTEHEISMRVWNDNILSSETLKSVRAKQDRQEGYNFLAAQYVEMQSRSKGSMGATNSLKEIKWGLDEVEGRNRMRFRLSQSRDATDLNYKPKRSTRSNTMTDGALQDQQNVPNFIKTTPMASPADAQADSSTSDLVSNRKVTLTLPDDDFEMVDDPNNVGQDTEDKNRKVMRSLQRGEQVMNVYNVSRIRGLEALESLLIIGRKALYIVDNLFQRSDGEVVQTDQAPTEERDSFVRMIAGREVNRDRPRSTGVASTTRYWPWAGIVSISKRTFLLRPVAVEIFFEDGRSYLLVAVSEQQRDKLYSSLHERSLRLQETSSKYSDVGAWRLHLLSDPKEVPSTVAGRFAKAFTMSSTNPETQKWVKGEMSNFQYLMMINTMAGRTFNDLTQYPVFPWILADYTSADLDLTNPRSFRDLSKPMGGQNAQRESAFRERFSTFADMNENQTPAFHYGTHYSSAMIVTSYLIRLQPYVDSYLLLQGGAFDHADRLFFSVEKAWNSASQTNMTDVRELTPEFFYLPDFLKNGNGYDFGQREANGARVDHVQLPPWAKGDPKIFVWKHRQALESPYVSQSLHLWVDLVFGFKQRGEAAIEATNVFHHLSYQGSRDIDSIDDPMERLATIGIIHNFGQTPRQVFSRPHPQRVITSYRAKSIHKAIDSLTRLPSPAYEYAHPIMELNYNQPQQRLLFCGPGRTYLLGHEVVLEWANADGSVRFFAMDGGQPMGLYEGLHQDDITAARFTSSTLVTASKDCTIGLWNVSVTAGAVDLQLDDFLFGHRHPVCCLVVSDVLSVLLSADTSGRIMLWDLNTHEFIREFEVDGAINTAAINSHTGHLLLASGQRILLYTINGEQVVEHTVGSHHNDRVTCSVFYENSGNEWVDAELVFTGHPHGTANVWKVTFNEEGRWLLENVRRLDHLDRTRVEAFNYSSTITAICTTDTSVYIGDDDGRVFEWTMTR